MKPALKDSPFCQKNVVSQDRVVSGDRFNCKLYRSLCRKLLVFQDRWCHGSCPARQILVYMVYQVVLFIVIMVIVSGNLGNDQCKNAFLGMPLPLELNSTRRNHLHIPPLYTSTWFYQSFFLQVCGQILTSVLCPYAMGPKNFVRSAWIKTRPTPLWLCYMGWDLEWASGSLTWDSYPSSGLCTLLICSVSGEAVVPNSVTMRCWPRQSL